MKSSLIQGRSCTVSCDLAFWQGAGDLSSPVPFQLTVKSPPSSTMAFLHFARLQIRFSDNRDLVTLEASATHEDGTVDVGDLGTGSSSATIVPSALHWEPGSSQVFAGTVSSSETRELSVRMPTPFLHAWALTLSLTDHGRYACRRDWKLHIVTHSST